MKKNNSRCLRWRITHEQLAATAVEYSVIVALIAAVIITAVAVIGQTSDASFDCVGQAVTTTASTNC